jgi:long-chain acyl-CoA synthetase
MYPGTYGATQPDKVAVARPATGETLTYRQLDERSNQLAQLLYAHGLRRGDHVALHMENHLVYFDVIWACMRSGLYLTPINRYLTAPEAAYIVDNCDARVLIASGQNAESTELGRLSPRCDLKLAVGGSIDGFSDYEQAIADQPATRLDEEYLGALMLYSSGTTGRPKGILRPLRDLPPSEGNPPMTAYADLYGMDASTVYLSPAPMYHSAPIGFTSAALQAGGSVVMMDRFDAATALDLIERHQVTHSQWVPTMFVRMLKLDEAIRAGRDLSSHRCAIHAAAPCPIEVKRQMIDWWGPILEEYYGSTEGAGMAAIGSREWLEHPGSVGRARGKLFHICDEAGNELPPGEPGLIYGESVFGLDFGYHKDDGKTAASRHPTQPEWVAVGDVGYLDKDGYLFLTDRKAFMIISGGVNIYPQQIEDILALHPKVADVAVIGVPNPDLGEEVKAVVEPAPGVEPSEALAQEIMEFVRGKLGRQLTPRSIDFTDALPRLPTGKLYKKALKDQYWGAGAGVTPLAARS